MTATAAASPASAARPLPAAHVAEPTVGDIIRGRTPEAVALRDKYLPAMLLVLAALFPILDMVLGLNMMNPMLRILTSVMLALGLNIVVGFAGLLDLGYVAFWAIGAYVVGWFASGHFAGSQVHLFSGIAPTMPGIHISVWLLFVVAAFVTAFFGVLLGAPTLRLRGDYLAIVTLGFGEIIPKVFQNGDEIAGANLTNGTRGISGLDTPSLGGESVDRALGLGWGTWGPLNLLPWYVLGIALVALCWYISAQMQWSKLGRAWQAIREDETAAAAMGINLVNTKLWAYGIGAALGGVAGVYHGARIGSIFPASFQFYISISLLCMVIIGGMGNVYGAILGAFAIEGLNFWLLPQLTSWANAVGISVDFSSWNLLIFGALLVVMMLYRPQGFLPAKARVIELDDDPYPAAHVPSRELVDDQPAGHGVQHYPQSSEGPPGYQHATLDVLPVHGVPIDGQGHHAHDKHLAAGAMADTHGPAAHRHTHPEGPSVPARAAFEPVPDTRATHDEAWAPLRPAAPALTPWNERPAAAPPAAEPRVDVQPVAAGPEPVTTLRASVVNPYEAPPVPPSVLAPVRLREAGGLHPGNPFGRLRAGSAPPFTGPSLRLHLPGDAGPIAAAPPPRAGAELAHVGGDGWPPPAVPGSDLPASTPDAVAAAGQPSRPRVTFPRFEGTPWPTSS